MGKKRTISFYEFQVNHPHKDQQMQVLAANMKELAPRYPQLKQIASLTDLMLSASVLTDIRAIDAVSPDVWCLYRIMTGQPITEENP